MIDISRATKVNNDRTNLLFVKMFTNLLGKVSKKCSIFILMLNRPYVILLKKVF